MPVEHGDRRDEGCARAGDIGGTEPPLGPEIEDRLRRYAAQRRLRLPQIGPDLFADPAWDILIDLYVNERRGLKTTVSNACVASMVPASTALRYISRLEHCGLVVRRRSDADRRLAYLRLTPTARIGLARWVTAVFAT